MGEKDSARHGKAWVLAGGVVFMISMATLLTGVILIQRAARCISMHDKIVTPRTKYANMNNGVLKLRNHEFDFRRGVFKIYTSDLRTDVITTGAINLGFEPITLPLNCSTSAEEICLEWDKKMKYQVRQL